MLLVLWKAHTISIPIKEKSWHGYLLKTQGHVRCTALFLVCPHLVPMHAASSVYARVCGLCECLNFTIVSTFYGVQRPLAAYRTQSSTPVT